MAVSVPHLRTASGTGRSRADGWAARIAAVLVGVVVSTMLLVDRWRTAEAAAATGLLRLLGTHGVVRSGDQLLVGSGGARPFVITVGAWCSSVGVVASLALAAALVPGAVHRGRGAATSCTIVVVGNLARITATVLAGTLSGPRAIEHFHDGIATTFAVVLVLAALAVLATNLYPPRRHPARHPETVRQPLLRRRTLPTPELSSPPNRWPPFWS
jgi:exosortase/archaeosortase family protein